MRSIIIYAPFSKQSISNNFHYKCGLFSVKSIFSKVYFNWYEIQIWSTSKRSILNEVHFKEGPFPIMSISIFIMYGFFSSSMHQIQGNRARNNGINIIPIAFGDGTPAPILNSELALIGATASSYLRVNSDTELINLVNTLNTLICPSNVKNTSCQHPKCCH